ncbi:hypothetical protein Hc94105_0487 [Helicobacter cinaedi]|uniref:hypothetical protein n=1 Tax=Helicobacter cinaedi TaxID=213 RepID=UPI001F296D3A|nr:hypothetical protein [Helicobacter cinaedi]BDB66299.1 hypothetical protein Hc94105_0487 [Helicobacter cinaedi]
MSSNTQDGQRNKLDSITLFQLKWLFYTTLFWGGLLVLHLRGELPHIFVSYGIFCLFFISNGIYKHNIKAFLIFAFVYIVLLFIFGATDYSFMAYFSVQMLLYSLILTILIFKKYYRLSITLCAYIAFYALALLLGEYHLLGSFYK